MSEYNHWLDESSDADDFERAVLRSGLEANPPQGQEAEVWSGMLSALALAPLAAATTRASAGTGASANTAGGAGGAGKAAGVLLGVGKGFIAGLALYGATTGIIEIAQRPSTPPALPALVSSHAAQTSTGPRAARPTPEREPEAPQATPSVDSLPLPRPSASPVTSHAATSAIPSLSPPAMGEPPRVAAFPEPVSATHASQLRAESAALRRARAELRAGKLAQAQSTLTAASREFTAPELSQEREALTIELLARSGQVTAARTRAQAFLAHFPDSPHAAAVLQFSGN